MTKAREIISNCLTFGLNKLSPGETLDADFAARALAALNDIVDSINGGKTMLFREIFSSGTVSGTSGTLGVNWAGLVSGDEILGATIEFSAGIDTPLQPITMDAYQAITNKGVSGGFSRLYAHDGAATVYFWPAPAGQNIKLRTKQAVSDFSDLDTDYTLPKGWRSALADMLAEKLSLTVLGGTPEKVVRDARMARQSLKAQALSPAIIQPGGNRGNILTGWN